MGNRRKRYASRAAPDLVPLSGETDRFDWPVISGMGAGKIGGEDDFSLSTSLDFIKDLESLENRIELVFVSPFITVPITAIPGPICTSRMLNTCDPNQNHPYPRE